MREISSTHMVARLCCTHKCKGGGRADLCARGRVPSWCAPSEWTRLCAHGYVLPSHRLPSRIFACTCVCVDMCSELVESVRSHSNMLILAAPNAFTIRKKGVTKLEYFFVLRDASTFSACNYSWTSFFMHVSYFWTTPF